MDISRGVGTFWRPCDLVEISPIYVFLKRNGGRPETVANMPRASRWLNPAMFLPLAPALTVNV